MAVSPIRAHTADDSWRMAGCGERCRDYVIVQQGRRYPERLVVHDPGHHEAYGEHVLGPRHATPTGTTVETGNLVIDTASARVFVDGCEVRLSGRERSMAHYLATRAGAIVPLREMLRAVWGPEYDTLTPISYAPNHSHEGQMVRNQVCRLRKRLGSAGRLVATAPHYGLLLLLEPVSAVQP